MTVETAFGAIRMKVARMNGRSTQCGAGIRRLPGVLRRGVPLKQVLAEASYEFQKQRGREVGRDGEESEHATETREHGNGSSEKKRRCWRNCAASVADCGIFWRSGFGITGLGSEAALGGRALAITALSPSFSEYDRRAAAFAREWTMRHEFIVTHEVENPLYRANRPDRCYHCKDELFGKLRPLREARGFQAVAYGVNADDLQRLSPGSSRREEQAVAAPLLDAGLTKSEIRELSRRAGLSTWDRPASACLASRVPYGIAVRTGGVWRASKALRTPFASWDSANFACALTVNWRESRLRRKSCRERCRSK